LRCFGNPPGVRFSGGWYQTFSRQIKAASILEALEDRMPNHPGIVHYIIHSYDYAPLAQRGLFAAMRCAQLAPAAPHALHMPAHIFSMLGMWHESIQSNLASKAALTTYNGENYGGAADPTMLHSMDFLVYDYLQLAQDKAARQVVGERNAVQRFVCASSETRPTLRSPSGSRSNSALGKKQHPCRPGRANPPTLRQSPILVERSVGRAAGTRKEQTLISPASASSKRSLWGKTSHIGPTKWRF
jgi:hypothetical protein